MFDNSFLNKNENILKIIAFLFGRCKYMPYIYNIIITQKQRDMKTSKVYQAVNGQVFRTETEAKEYYGNRFEGALQANILFKIVIDEDGNEIGEW